MVFRRVRALLGTVRCGASARLPARRLELALLNARALLRLDRPDDALTVLRDAGAIPCDADQSITVRMLTGAAHVRRGDVDHGLELLHAAQADGAAAHRTIRSELALNVALAHYARHDFDAAERALHSVEPTRTSSTRARWNTSVGSRSRGSTASAPRHCSSLRSTRSTVAGITIAFWKRTASARSRISRVERLDRRTWAIVEDRRAKMDWSGDGLAQPRFWIAYCAATFAVEVQGNALKAAREARDDRAQRAQRGVPRASALQALGDRALRRRTVSQRDHAESAAELYASLNASNFSGDEAIVSLVLAEELDDARLQRRGRAAVTRS